MSDGSRLMRALVAVATLSYYLLTAGCATAAETIEISIGVHLIKAEVAASDAQRARGLMERTELKTNEGMLFIFSEPDYHAMWMKNTPLPLSVAFIDERGSIINIAEMKPLTLDAHGARKPAKYALEMNTGWFAKRSIGAGMKVSGLEKAASAK